MDNECCDDVDNVFEDSRYDLGQGKKHLKKNITKKMSQTSKKAELKKISYLLIFVV